MVHLQDGGNSQILLNHVEDAMKELLEIRFKRVKPHYEIGDSESALVVAYSTLLDELCRLAVFFI